MAGLDAPNCSFKNYVQIFYLQILLGEKSGFGGQGAKVYFSSNLDLKTSGYETRCVSRGCAIPHTPRRKGWMEAFSWWVPGRAGWSRKEESLEEWIRAATG